MMKNPRALNDIKFGYLTVHGQGGKKMIERAKEIDSEGIYIHADLGTLKPEKPANLIHSMEVLYYLDDIPKFPLFHLSF